MPYSNPYTDNAIEYLSHYIEVTDNMRRNIELCRNVTIQHVSEYGRYIEVRVEMELNTYVYHDNVLVGIDTNIPQPRIHIPRTRKPPRESTQEPHKEYVYREQYTRYALPF